MPKDLSKSSRKIFLCKESEINFIERTNENYMSLYKNPVIEYSPSFKRPDGVYVAGRLAYFGPAHFNIAKDFKKIV